MKKIFIVPLAAVFLYSCSGNKTEETAAETADSVKTVNNLQIQIVGEWKSSALKVKINTALNSDSTEIIDVNEENWERVLKTKPMKTIFKDDGSYVTEYRNKKDSVIKFASGKWYTVNDSLYLNQKQPDMMPFQYKVVVDNNMATFSGIVDWEGDEKVDDEYVSTMKK